MRLLLIICIFLFPQMSFAETVWCRKLNIGCPTEADLAKTIRNCEMLANERYSKALTESMVEPSIWQLAGSKSAQDYASTRGELMKEICMKQNS
jgi:hypothetical protein